jgi:hypothetical protein
MAPRSSELSFADLHFAGLIKSDSMRTSESEREVGNNIVYLTSTFNLLCCFGCMTFAIEILYDNLAAIIKASGDETAICSA